MKTSQSYLQLRLCHAVFALVIAWLGSSPVGLYAQVPQIINYQGKISVGAAAFTGNGQFKFALVNGDGTTSFWSHDGSSVAGSEPASAVSLPIANGMYVVPLGDTVIPNMSAVPVSVFENTDVRLRVWFNDGVNGSQLLAPDQRITSVGYAMAAGTVPDGAITAAKISPSAVDGLSGTLVQTLPDTQLAALEPIVAFDAVALTTDGSGTARLVRANATDDYRSAFFGFAKTSAALGEAVVVHQYGPLAGFSGLAKGRSHYVSGTDGAISSLEGGTPIYVGHALSSSVLFVDTFGFTKHTGLSNYWGSGADGELSTTGNISFGSVQDGDVVVKQFNNLTINAGHTVTTSNRCRGLVIYVNGDCTIDGTLSMTARGANVNPTLADSIPETGIRLVRLKTGANETLTASDLGGAGAGGVGAAWRAVEVLQTGVFGTGKVYTISREGGAGGSANHSNDWWDSQSGYPGGASPDGTGGGGGGNAAGGWSGSGSAGTCYSGGSGGGAVRTNGYATSAGNAAAYGGAGGYGNWTSPHDQGGGGAGNPGGSGNQPGQSGTGGLLVLMVKGNLTIGASGQVVSRGSNGGSAYQPGGGSGGGRILILHGGIYSAAVAPSANGGTGGGAGGAGAVTIDQVNP